MNRRQVLTAFEKLNDALMKRAVKGEVCVVGGAAMVLAFNARKATRDIDGIFEPSATVREAALEVAKKLRLPKDWLNDAVKGYLPGKPASKNTVVQFAHLLVWTPPADYLLAMKAISARFDTMDAEDFRTLCRHLALKDPAEVFELVSRYYPANRVPPKTVFFVEELFETKIKGKK